MAGLSININSLAENTARLGERISENLAERTRELTLARGPHYLDASESKINDVRRQLESNTDREKLDALKTLIALISKGRNVSDFFPSVVKNVASSNLEIRKLVYIYLLRYAETEPDLALLSINTFQRDLADPNPLIRAMALRVLSGINVPMVSNLVILAVKKGAGDPSPYVRKAAALATIKCFRMDSSHLPSLIPIVSDLLRDTSPLAIGSTVAAFSTICPTRLDLLHPHYRRLCRMLLDIDVWGQVNVMELLSRYARVMLPRPVAGVSTDDPAKPDVDPDLSLLLSSITPLLMSNNPAVVITAARLIYYLAPASQVVDAINPLLRLLYASNEVERVVLASLLVIADQYPLALSAHYSRFLTVSSDLPVTKRIKLCILVRLATLENQQSIVNEFMTCAFDGDPQVVATAIHAIGHCAITLPSAFTPCLKALLALVKSGEECTVTESVLVLNSMVQILANSPPGDATTSRQSILSLASDLAANIRDFTHPSARACVLWLIGQYSAVDASDGQSVGSSTIPGLAYWVPDALRQVTKTFQNEASIVKLQLLSLAAKVQVLVPDMPSALQLLVRHVFDLARYDENYDVRDRARMLSSLSIGISSSKPLSGELDDNESEDAATRTGVILRREQVKLVLFEGKTSSNIRKPSYNNSAQFGTLTTVTGKSAGLDSWLVLPDWLEEGTEPTLRDSTEEYPSRTATSLTNSNSRGRISGTRSHVHVPEILRPTVPDTHAPSHSQSSSGPATGKKQWANLDDFLNEAPGSENSDEEESSDGTSEEGEEGEEHNNIDIKSTDKTDAHPSPPPEDENGASTDGEATDDSDESSD